MKKTISYFALLLFSCLSEPIHAQGTTDTLYVYLKDARLEVFAPDVVKSYRQLRGGIDIVLKNDSVISYGKSEFDRLGKAPQTLPQFTSFKFNNKYNENVYTDVFATIKDHEVSASVPAIGKYLTPSFQLNDPLAKVYVDDELQQSKVSRHRFDEQKIYTLAHPGYRQMKYVKIKDEEWSEGTEGGYETESVPLTAAMLSTNAPSNYNEGLDKLVDNNPSTFFHSTWGSGTYDKLPLDQHPYIQVDLNADLQKFVLEYTTSHRHDNRFPYEILVKASNDGQQWTDICSLTKGLPTTGLGVDYTSPAIDLKKGYRKLRFELVRASYKNYFVLSRLAVKKVVAETPGVPPHLVSPARYVYKWHPFGRDVAVKVEWPTDSVKNVPRIDINLASGIGASQINKSNYLPATFRLSGGGVFPDMEAKVNIKGRGNITWNYPKKPYRLKFDTAVKPFGMTKGKSWVLLANAQKNSMIANMVGMKVARRIGTAGANDMIPVELYINGLYVGSYCFTQHVGLHNNSIDADETRAALLEIDTYFDAIYKFKSSHFGLPVNVKDPDLEEWPSANATAQFNRIQSDFNKLSKAVYEEQDYDKLIDVTMLARYLLVNELVLNLELHHPKSVFLFREDLQALHSKYVFGPVWDLDWAFGYETNSNYCTAPYNIDFYTNRNGIGMQFFRKLRYSSEKVRRACYVEWKRLLDHHMEEILDYIDDYYAYAEPSFRHNAMIWGDGHQYRQISDNFKKWIKARAEYVFENMESFDLEEPQPITVGDVNNDGAITIADVNALNHYILNIPGETIDKKQADVNGNGKINVTDLVHLVALLIQEDINRARWESLPLADVKLKGHDFIAATGQIVEMPLDVNIKEGAYSGMQFDVILPEGMRLNEVMLPDEWKGYNVKCAERGDGSYRVLLYGGSNCLPVGKSLLQLRMVPETVVNTAQRIVTFEGATMVCANGFEERLSAPAVLFDMEQTGVDEISSAEGVSGGDVLTVEALRDGMVRIYRIDGRLFRVCNMKAGTNRIHLPSGVYVVNHKKIIINKSNTLPLKK